MVYLKFICCVIYLFLTGSAMIRADELSYAFVRPQPQGTARVDLDDCLNRLRQSGPSEVEMQSGGRSEAHRVLLEESSDGPQNFHETLWDNKIHQARPGGFFSDSAFLFNALPEEASLESKLFLSQDLGQWNLTTHFVLEKEFKTGSPLDLTCVVSLSRPISNTVQFGLEYFDQPVQGKRYLVPGVYSKIGEVTLNLGLQWGLNGNDDTIGVRSFMMWEF